MSDESYIYEPNSFAGKFDESQLRDFEEYLRECEQPIKFDMDYVSHLRKYHGGRVRRRFFLDEQGFEHSVVRFLNFTSRGHELSDYQVPVAWSMADERLGVHLMPFAALFGGDLLCFDHQTSPPCVVVWDHEMSEPDEESVVYKVAASFVEFLSLLSDEPVIG